MSFYTFIFRRRALKEYADSTAWYKDRSLQASDNFVSVIEKSLLSIAKSPYFLATSTKNLTK